MIIVNQDKTMIVNFRNVENIKIRKLPVNESGYAISVETFDSAFDRFAIYETEERAKEVLQEIIKKYEKINFGKYFKSPMIEPSGQKSFAYEMPEK